MIKSNTMVELSERQQHILHAIIVEYTSSAIPVSSKTISESYIHGMSPATIRAELAELEQLGFLDQPHTSSGRIPTDIGYRYFVNSLMEENALSHREQCDLERSFRNLRKQHQRMSKTLALLLAEHSQSVAVAGEFRHNQKETYDTGLQQLMNQPEFYNKSDHLAQVVELLEYFEENIESLSEQSEPCETIVSIGEEGLYSAQTDECSVILSSFSHPQGQRGIIAIIGPKRMPYARNVSIVRHLSTILSKGTPLVLLIMSITFVS